MVHLGTGDLFHWYSPRLECLSIGVLEYSLSIGVLEYNAFVSIDVLMYSALLQWGPAGQLGCAWGERWPSLGTIQHCHSPRSHGPTHPLTHCLMLF